MKTATELIVLNTTKYGEKSLVVHCLSRDFGRRSFFVRSAPPVSSLFSPMAILEGNVVELPHLHGTMPSLTSLSRRVNLPRTRGNLYKSSITLFMAEVLFRAIPEGVTGDGLYDWCVSQIMLLEALDKDVGNFPLLFLLELTVGIGFRPEFRDIAPFVPENLHPEMRRLMSLPFAEAMLVPLSGSSRNSLSDAVLRYIEVQLDAALNIRSLAVLRELMSSI